MTHKGTIRLETPRLILRRYVPGDAQAMFVNWASDEEVTKFLTWPAHSDVEVTKNVIQSWISSYSHDDYYQWAIELKEISQPIGGISAVHLNDELDIVHIGYCIGTRWWHRGYTSEALAAVIRYLFREVGVNRIETQHDPENPHSGGVMRKCGMQYEGTLRQAIRSNRGITDAAVYSILAADYKG